jgi:hypothetical protein
MDDKSIYAFGNTTPNDETRDDATTIINIEQPERG